MDMRKFADKLLASLAKSKNYIPPKERNLERIIQLRKARKQAKKEHIAKRKESIETRRRAILHRFENTVSKELTKINNNPKISQFVKIIANMQYLMNFIIANPEMLDLLNEFDKKFIPYLDSTQDKIDTVIELNDERNLTGKQRKERKRPEWVKRGGWSY